MSKEYYDTKWIGSYPDDWKIVGLTKYIESKVDYRGKTPNKTDDGIFLVTAKNIKNGMIDYELSKEYISKNDYSKVMSRGLPLIGDVLFTTEAPLGEVASVDKLDIALAQRVIKLRANSNYLSNYYLKYWMLSEGFYQNLQSFATGSTALGIKSSKLFNLRLLLPPNLNIQTVIVNFLNKKLNEINKLISLKENQIELLEEQRQAMITEAVTKGLDADAEKKESGIEWMGEIPKHWTITKIKYTTYVKGRIGWQGLRSEEFIDDGPYLVTGTDFDNGLINWNGCYHISENRYNEALPIQLKEDDLLITKDGTIGKIAMVKEMPDKAILNSGIFVTRPLRNQYHNNYMFWNLKSSSFSEYIKLLETGSTIKHLYQETFVNYSYALPPIDEQIEISNLLIKKNDEFDKLLLNIKKQLFKLNEYRQALIHEAVTGKIPVDEMEKYLKEVEENGN